VSSFSFHFLVFRHPNHSRASFMHLLISDPRVTAHTPIIGVDIWEHAFYLQYHNVKPDVCVFLFLLFCLLPCYRSWRNTPSPSPPSPSAPSPRMLYIKPTRILRLCLHHFVLPSLYATSWSTVIYFGFSTVPQRDLERDQLRRGWEEVLEYIQVRMEFRPFVTEHLSVEKYVVGAE